MLVAVCLAVCFRRLDAWLQRSRPRVRVREAYKHDRGSYHPMCASY